MIKLDIFPSYLHSFTSLSKKKQIESNEFIIFPKSELIEVHTLHTLPRGTETGIILHSLFEKVFTSFPPIWKDLSLLSRFVKQEISMTKLVLWSHCISHLLIEIANLPFLKPIEPKNIQAEVEFIYEDSPNFIKGFVDLIFIHDQKLYFIDWKSNWLGETNESYEEEKLILQMEAHDYNLQAAIYGKALSTSFNQCPFGGAYYLFLRGIDSPSKGVLFVPPRSKNGILD
jgi:exodeoxyribonuclease V beta subunit